ncbi:MAG: hypothetical protein R3C19_14285 [Planctomycetaceae bacterium]
MTRPDRNLPEPSLPEYGLIRDAAPTVRLSSGFRDRVLTECDANIRVARRAFWRKVVLTSAGVCCGSLLLWIAAYQVSQPIVSVPSTPAPSSNAPQHPPTGNYNSGYPEPGSLGPQPDSPGLAVGSPRPVPKTDLQQMDQMMDDLKNRTRQMFDAGMLPDF